MRDEQIIELYWQRKETAIDETKAKYGGYCYTIANNILRNHEDSEECVGDTYLKTWNSIPPQKPDKLRLFLARITRNLAIDRYKYRTAAKRSGQETDLMLDELEEIVTSDSSPDREIEVKELAKSINLFLRTLPERDCSVFIRRYFFAESAADIGKRLNLSPGNVGVVLSRVRAKLRKHLEKEGYIL